MLEAQKFCPECGAAVSPSLGAAQPASTPWPPPAPTTGPGAPDSRAWWQKKRWWFSIIGASLIVIAVAGAGDSSSPTTTTDNGQTVDDSRLGAFDVCKQFVSRRLRSPATAEWRDPFGDQVFYTGSGDGPIVITASVDSENGFGAKLRTSYTCAVTRVGGTEWHLDDLTM